MTPSKPARHLLIVDDEPVILQVLRAVFEDEPYRLTCAGTGADALRIIEEQGCDLLLTDKNLPDIGGLDLVREARRRNPHCEAIIITGYASLETAIEALELGAFDYILKPLDNVFDIRTKVRKALEKLEMAEENRRLLDHLRQRTAELEAALAETRALQAELVQSEKLAGIGTLAAGVAHEISSPLFGIMGLAEAITEEEDLAVVRDYARDIVVYCRNIRDIVVELSSYSRASADADEAVVDLGEVVADALTLLDRASAARAVRIQADCPPGLRVRGRARELQQVALNLLRNAAEAAAEGSGEGRVFVSAWREGDDAVLRVEDDGPGIPADRRAFVFDPFYTTKPPGKGTGLGLNVAYRIVTRHRGTIAVEEGSDGGLGGAVFVVRLPLADPAG